MGQIILGAEEILRPRVVFYLSGRWMYPKIKEKAEFNWSVVNFPYGKDKQLADTSGWAVTKDCKNKDVAIKFVQFLSSEKSAKYFAQTGLVVPARIKASKVLENKEHNEKIFLGALTHLRPTIVDKDYKKTVDEINLKYIK